MRQAAITDRSPHSTPYKPHRPEQTLLYQVIERYYPAFREVMAAQGRPLPLHVQQEFADYLKCDRLEHGFLRGQCTECHLTGTAIKSREPAAVALVASCHC